MSAVTPEPRHAIASLPAGKVLTRAWLALILILLALIGLFYLGTGLQMETLAGKPLNMAGLALAIGVGLLCAVCTVFAVLFGIRAVRLGKTVGLIPAIAGLGCAVVLILGLIQVIVGLTTGKWT